MGVFVISEVFLGVLYRAVMGVNEFTETQSSSWDF